MCESSAYLRKNENDEELLLEDVVMVKPRPGMITLTNILGDRKEIEAEIDHIDLMKHRIILRPVD